MIEKKLEFNNVNFFYGSKQIFNGLNFSFPFSSLFVISGASGVGKSTMMKLISAQIKPTNGRILINGDIITTPSKKILLVQQENDLFPWSTIEKQFNFFSKVGGDYDLALKLIELFGLKEDFRKNSNQISIGTQKRFALVRSIMFSPEVLILDETLSSLDVVLRQKVLDFIVDWTVKSKKLTLITSHFENEIRGDNIISLKLSANYLTTINT